MKETNLTPSPRLKGRCCLTDFLYSKATLLLLIFMLPLVGIAQQNLSSAQKEKEARNQAYMDKIYGNKPENVLSNVQLDSPDQRVIGVRNQENLQSEYEQMLEKFNIDEQKYLSNGFTRADIQAEIDRLIAQNENPVTFNSTPVLARTTAISDLCGTAVQLTCDEEADGSTVGASATGYIDCGGGPSNGEGVWYKVIGNNFNNTVSVVSSSFNVQLHVYSSIGGNCSSIQCAGGTSGQGSSSVTFFAPFDDIFFINVVGVGSGEGTYTLARTSTGPCNDTPPGDGLTAATGFPIACGDVETGSTVGATPSQVPSSCGTTPSSAGVWYQFTAVAGTPENISVRSCNSDYDSKINVYSGDPNSLDCVGGDDDDFGTYCFSNDGFVDFVADLDETYYIYVSGFSSNTGNYEVTLVCDGNVVTPPPSAPNNDLCPDAIEITCSGADQVIAGTTIAATTDGAPTSCGSNTLNGVGVWYYIDGDGSAYTITTCGYDTELSIFTGSCGSFTCLVSNDDTTTDECTSNTNESQVTFGTEEDVRYYVYVSSFSSTFQANFDLIISCIPPPEPPANDDCASAESIACGDFVSGNTSLATADSVPFCDSDAATDTPGVWYAFTGTGEIVTASLVGITYDAVISVYTGGCSGLTCLIGENGDFSDDSEVEWLSEVGTEYLIFVSGFFGATGAFELEVFCQPDPCTNATQISCEDSVVIGNNSGANGSTAGPTGTCGTSLTSPGVMYEFVGTDKFVNINTCGSNFDTKLFVYSGLCGELQCVTGNDDTSLCADTSNESEVEFFASSDQSYYIWVSGFSNATGDFQLNISCLEPEGNDLCEDAIALACNSSIDGSTELSTRRDAVAGSCEDATAENGVWYTVTGTGGTIVASTCGTADFDTQLIVYSGTCGDLTCVAANDDADGCSGGTSEVEFISEENATYYIYVSGFGEQKGDFTLTIDCLCFSDDLTEGTECVTLYDGYDPASTAVLTGNLYGTDSAPEDVTYAWSNGASTQSITVSAADGVQNYSVTMTDESGCSSVETFFVYVVDVNCDTRGTDKVELCHNGQTICVAPSAVESHLAHGDELGACGTAVCDELIPYCDLAVTSPADGEVDVPVLAQIDWTPATGIVDGYSITIGTTSGGNDVADNLDLGNVLSYSTEELAYETTYYYTITAYNSVGSALGCTEYSFTTAEDPFPNDDCAGAIALAVNGPEDSCLVSYTADNVFNTPSDDSFFSCDGTTGNIDSWYTFVAPASGTVVISVTNGSQTGTAEGALFLGTCGGSQVDCDGSINGEEYSGLTPGATYTLAIWWDDFNTEGTYTVCINQPAPPPANDDCAGAVALTVNPTGSECAVVYSADHSSATDSFAGIGCDGSDDIDTWYTFVAPASGAIDMSAVEGTQTDNPGWAIYDSCNGSEVFCVNNTSSEQRVEGLTPGATYTLVVWYDGFATEGTFDICLNEFVPAGPTIVTCGTPVSTSHCYDNNDNTQFKFTSDDGSPLEITFTSGTIESCCDDIIIYDGLTTSDPVLYSGNNGGDLAGLAVGGTSDSLLLVIDSDGSVSCASGSRTTWNFDVDCYVPAGPTMVTCGAPVNTSHCYGNNDSTQFKFTSDDGSPLGITFNSGTIESCCDDIIIYDGLTTSDPVLYSGNNGGNLAGLVVGGTSDSLLLVIDSDGSVSCASGSRTTWNFDVDCYVAPPPPACNDMSINMNTGGYGYEVSWTLVGPGVNISSPYYGSSYSSYSQAANLPDGNYTMNMYDSYGDGWNGGTFNIVDGNGSTVASGGLGTGLSFGTVNFTVACGSARIANNTKTAEVVDWSMAPNPTRGNVTLDLTNYLQSDVSIEVMNVTGKVIFNTSLKNLQGSKYDVELNSSLPAGMYFVRVAANGEVSTKKLMIMR